jgi:hypothetical protein
VHDTKAAVTGKTFRDKRGTRWRGATDAERRRPARVWSELQRRREAPCAARRPGQELHDAKADGAALGRAPMGGEDGRAASSPRGEDVDVAVKSAVVMFTATALIPCLAPSGSRRHGTPGTRSPVFETVVVLDGSGASSCSVSSFVPVLGAALVVSKDGTLGMARLTVGEIGGGVRAGLRKSATGCGAPEHAATEQRGGAGGWESAALR